MCLEMPGKENHSEKKKERINTLKFGTRA